ncbi:hypothetical protein KY382_33355, partial [Pseudomonas monteilii]|nr:hypothetical protein [Pseudomonas monteilii]
KNIDESNRILRRNRQEKVKPDKTVRRQKGARQRGLAGRSKNEKVLGLFVGIQVSYRENMKNFRVKFRNCVNLLTNYGFCLNFFLKEN